MCHGLIVIGLPRKSEIFVSLKVSLLLFFENLRETFLIVAAVLAIAEELFFGKTNNLD